MALEELVDEYGRRYDELRLTSAELVEQLWLEFGGPDDRRAAEAAELMLEAVNTAAGEAAELVDGYVAEYVSTVSGKPPPRVNALDLAEYAVDQLRGGARGLDVYRRPAIEARRLLAEGRPYDDAMAQAGRRASGMAQADVALAHRSAGSRAMDTYGADGYRRVLTGASCLLCAVASTQRYKNAELMPIHTRCDCRVAPIVGDTDYGQIVNRELYRELKSSGQLDRLNARMNRAGSGRARARAAETRRRASQMELDGVGRGRGTQAELDLRRPASGADLERELAAGAGRRTASAGVNVGVRQHGEMGPVLVNDRHAFTAAAPPRRAGAHRLEADLDELPGRRPPAEPGVVDAPAPPRAPAAPRARYDVDSPEVVRAARRRNLPPERVAAELNEKAALKARQAAEARDYARSLSVDHPDVIRVAERNGVSADEVLVALPQVRAVRREMAEAAARLQAEAYGDLYSWEALKMAAPPRVRRGGEYDWLEQVAPAERARLSRLWYDQDPSRVYTPDQLAEQITAAIGRDLSVDEAVALWLDRTRVYEAAGAIRRGRLPSSRAYSGRIDVDNLTPGVNYLPSRVIGVDDLEAAGYIAARDAEAYADDALAMLGRAAEAELGPAPYRMGFQSWQDEVAGLEYALRNNLDEFELEFDDGSVVRYVGRELEDRLEELVPYYLDEPGASFEEVYARLIHTARRAGEEVPDYARIPWS